MLFHIRRKDGSIDLHSAGTYVDAGERRHTCAQVILSCSRWRKMDEPSYRREYPIHWKVAIPKLGIELEAKTPLESQELTGKSKLAPNYWKAPWSSLVSAVHKHSSAPGIWK